MGPNPLSFVCLLIQLVITFCFLNLPVQVSASLGDIDWPSRALPRLRQDGLLLSGASPEVRDDRSCVMAAVTQNWRALEFGSELLRDDRPVVQAAIAQHWGALQFASPELRDDRSIVQSAIRQNGLALKFASEGLRDDRALVQAAIRNLNSTPRGVALKFASAALRDDRSIVLETVKLNGLMWAYAGWDTKRDITVIREARKENIRAMGLNVEEDAEIEDEIRGVLEKELNTVNPSHDHPAGGSLGFLQSSADLISPIVQEPAEEPPDQLEDYQAAMRGILRRGREMNDRADASRREVMAALEAQDRRMGEGPDLALLNRLGSGSFFSSSDLNRLSSRGWGGYPSAPGERKP